MRLGQMLCVIYVDILASGLLLPVWLLWTPVRKEGGWKESFKRRLNMCNSPPERFKWRVFSQIERTPKQHVLLSSPPTPSALTFTCFLSPELRWRPPCFSLFFVLIWRFGVKKVSSVIFMSNVGLLLLSVSFQKCTRCTSYSSYYTTSYRYERCLWLF